MRLIDDWRRRLWRFHSVRVALGGVVFWGLITGLWTLWPAFVDRLPFWFYAVGGILMSIAVTYARAIKQPGIEK